MDMLKNLDLMELTIRLNSSVMVEPNDEFRDGSAVPSEFIKGLDLEIANFGYTLSGELRDVLAGLTLRQFYECRDHLHKVLGTITDDFQHTRLFTDFPYSTPDQYTYMANRIKASFASDYKNDAQVLDCGHVINDTFNLREFGACPICQQGKLEQSDIASIPFTNITPLKIIQHEDLGSIANRFLHRSSSLSGDERKFLHTAIDRKIYVTATGPYYRENLPYAYLNGGSDAVRDHLDSSTDILRIITLLSNRDADLSLAGNTRYRLKTSDKKAVMRLLETIPNLQEDMMRHREKWLRVGEILNPNQKKYQAQYPRVVAAFDALRNSPKDIETFNRKIEKSFGEENLTEDFFDMMKVRSGEFARRLDHILRIENSTGGNKAISAFKQIVDDLPTVRLLELRKYFASRNLLDQRIFLPKGQTNKMQVMPDNRAHIDPKILSELDIILEDAIIEKFIDRNPMGRVWIDPALRGIVLPYNRRGDSSTNTAVYKGSHLSLDGDILRLFVWWHDGPHSGGVDVDLSAVYMDENFNSTGHVAFTRLHDGKAGVVHSGDIQSAPQGASEFIDIDLKKISNSSRYLAVSLISYRGQTFDTFPCHVGYMERDGVMSGRVYEPASVKVKSDVDLSKTTIIPMIVDLRERKIIFADIPSRKSRFDAVQSEQSSFITMTRAIVSLPDRKPTLYDYLLGNVKARGELVDRIEDADIVYRIDDIEAIMGEINLLNR